MPLHLDLLIDRELRFYATALLLRRLPAY